MDLVSVGEQWVRRGQSLVFPNVWKAQSQLWLLQELREGENNTRSVVKDAFPCFSD